MTRIVGGQRGGRRLLVPAGQGTRPTSERAREGLFNTLAGLLELAGSAFADLYAGSGAVGLEATSRGAGRVLSVESDSRAAGTIRRNAAALGASMSIATQPVERLAQTAPPGGPFDVVFADPPYRLGEAAVDALLAALLENGWLATGGVLVIERDRRSRAPVWPLGVAFLKSRGYGEATLWYGRRA